MLEIIQSDMEELSSAEEFLEYFDIAFEPDIVQVSRLHILQRFHDYIAQSDIESNEEQVVFLQYRALLQRAYKDFVDSDAKTEKVFKVFRSMEPRQAVVPLSDLLKGGFNAAKV